MASLGANSPSTFYDQLSWKLLLPDELQGPVALLGVLDEDFTTLHCAHFSPQRSFPLASRETFTLIANNEVVYAKASYGLENTKVL